MITFSDRIICVEVCHMKSETIKIRVQQHVAHFSMFNVHVRMIQSSKCSVNSQMSKKTNHLEVEEFHSYTNFEFHKKKIFFEHISDLGAVCVACT